MKLHTKHASLTHVQKDVIEKRAVDIFQKSKDPAALNKLMERSMKTEFKNHVSRRAHNRDILSSELKMAVTFSAAIEKTATQLTRAALAPIAFLSPTAVTNYKDKVRNAPLRHDIGKTRARQNSRDS